MWSYAAQFDVNDIADLSDEQYDTCLQETHEYLRKHPSYVTSWKLQVNEGPVSHEERHTTKAAYNGDARKFKYYSRQVLLKQLAKRNNGEALLPHDATERQFMHA